MASLEDKVYRLRDIPADRDRLGVAELIKPFIPDGKLEDITIASLAPTCGFPGRSPTKTATVTVRKTPEIMNHSSTTGEWKLCTPALTNPLILDATFYGLTPLNEVEEHQHKYDRDIKQFKLSIQLGGTDIWYYRLPKDEIFWAYETQMTSTLESVNGTYRRSGPGTIMVSPQSATGNRCNSDPVSTIPINEDHSKMVKFSVGNHMIDTVADKLREILGNDQHGLDQDLERLAASNFQARASTSQGLGDIDSSDTRDPSEDPDFWYIKSIIKSLRAPERDKRLSQIDKRAGHSFEWAFEDPSVGLTEWLQKGDGLYWISGRPASGKSTFMKFLYNDKRTKQMLRHWYSKGKQHVEANFFFHYRGNLIQKSFEATLTPTEEKIIQDVQDIMHRYHEREKIRQFVQNEPWASPKLQQALFEIIHQRSINLEVCLFIDALDEHDGSPEFIVDRPWDIFMTAFGDRPGFRIHDHTENDIRELCIHIIQTECPHSQELLELIEEIVKRSNGVFLWAKLVLQDLTKIAVGAPGSDTGNLSSKLQDTLRSLPSDLIEYYRTIVERIPMSFRRERGRIIVVENICSSGEKHWLIMPNKPRELKRPRKHKPTRHKIRKIREIRVPLSRPKRMWKHVRDIESLNYSHYGLRERQHHQSCIRQKRSINKYVFLPNKAVCEMDAVKHYILKKYCPHIPLSEVHSGYHRSRRPLIGSIYYPDIISVHHLHLHVIVRPQWRRKWLRYALPLMWKSDEKVLLKVKEQASKRKNY
ncbi:hypothetical protein TrVFT333_009639 [Trichoderma virens FT-333]|nr:hypothetical protein TrVFT333_009639 [Trichoderma virens FT-333]